MKKLLLPILTIASLSMGSAANAQVNIDIGIGVPAVVVERPHRYYAPPPVVYVERPRHKPRAVYYYDHPGHGHKHFKKHHKKHYKKHGHHHGHRHHWDR